MVLHRETQAPREKLRLLPRSQREKLANYATVGLIALCTLVVGYWFVFVS